MNENEKSELWKSFFDYLDSEKKIVGSNPNFNLEGNNFRLLSGAAQRGRTVFSLPLV